jgi:hypothetical protein
MIPFVAIGVPFNILVIVPIGYAIVKDSEGNMVKDSHGYIVIAKI